MPASRKAYLTTIQVVVLAESDGEASDGVSELLRSVEERLNKQPNNWMLDWRYIGSKGQDAIGQPQHWTEINVPPADNYEEGEVFINIPDPTNK